MTAAPSAQTRRKQTVRDLTNWQGKRVLVRVDFNVPLDANGAITDDSRIRESLDTLRLLCEQGARVIVASHLGRPKGAVKEELRLCPVAKRLGELLPGVVVHKTNTVVGPEVTEAVSTLKNGELLLLENVRFEPGEEKNDPELAKQLAALADIYVNDAFGAAHRAHASTEGVARYANHKVAGLLMEREIEALGHVVNHPAKPLTAIIGGSKVSTKITVLQNLMDVVDTMVIVGAMMFTFLKAQGHSVGNSMVEADYLDTAQSLIELARQKGVKLLIPSQVVVAEAFNANATVQTVSSAAIPEGWMGLDVGPDGVKEITGALEKSKTVLWNGPLGVFEMAAFAQGTQAVANYLAQWTEAGGQSILGGGDTVAAIEQFRLSKSRYSHVSTGGGASLEFLEGKTLPGIAALDDA